MTSLLRVFLCVLFLYVGPAVPAATRGGPVSRVNTVQGFHTMTYRIRFEAGKAACIVVEGDGDTSLELLVVGPDGRRVAADHDNPDRPAVKFIPWGERVYEVKIINRGGVPNRFRLRIE